MQLDNKKKDHIYVLDGHIPKNYMDIENLSNSRRHGSRKWFKNQDMSAFIMRNSMKIR